MEKTWETFKLIEYLPRFPHVFQNFPIFPHLFLYFPIRFPMIRGTCFRIMASPRPPIWDLWTSRLTADETGMQALLSRS